jgi:hypothetical protein
MQNGHRRNNQGNATLISVMLAAAIGVIVSGATAMIIVNNLRQKKSIESSANAESLFMSLRQISFDPTGCNLMLAGNSFDAACQTASGCPVGAVLPFESKSVLAIGQNYSDFKVSAFSLSTNGATATPVSVDLGFGAGPQNLNAYPATINYAYARNNSASAMIDSSNRSFVMTILTDDPATNPSPQVRGCGISLLYPPTGQLITGQGVGAILNIAKFGQPGSAGPPLSAITDTSAGARYKVDTAVPRSSHWDSPPYDPIRIQITPGSLPASGRFSVDVVAYVTINSGCSEGNNFTQQVQYDVLTSSLANINNPTLAFSAPGYVFNYYTHKCDFRVNDTIQVAASGLVGLNAGDVLQIRFSNLALAKILPPPSASTFDGWSVTVTEIP